MISRRGSGILLGLALVFGAPALAGAQLFPDLPIRRQRPDCTQENPQYKQIRQDYWGYYPTCWRKFPPGWGCPSPEAPNWAEHTKKFPITALNAQPPAGGNDKQPTDDGGDPEKQPKTPTERPNTRPPGDAGGLPPLPTNPDSPFNLPDKPPLGTDPDKPATDKPATDKPATGKPAELPKAPDTPPVGSAQPRRRGGVIAGMFTRRP